MHQLTMAELDAVSGGSSWQQFGVAIASLAIGIATTDALAATSLGPVPGTGLASEIGLTGFAVGLAGAGGAVAGRGGAH